MSDISAYSLSFVVEFKKDVQYTPHDRKAAEWYSKTEKKLCRLAAREQNFVHAHCAHK